MIEDREHVGKGDRNGGDRCGQQGRKSETEVQGRNCEKKRRQGEEYDRIRVLGGKRRGKKKAEKCQEVL